MVSKWFLHHFVSKNVLYHILFFKNPWDYSFKLFAFTTIYENKPHLTILLMILSQMGAYWFFTSHIFHKAM